VVQGSVQSILILRGGALGDFIVTLPAISLLRQAYPEAVIDLVGNRRVAELVIDKGLIDHAYSQDESRWAALFRSEPLGWEIETWLSRYDLIVSFWPDPDGTLRAKLPVHPEQRFIVGEAQPAIAPAAAHFASALEPLGLTIDSLSYPLGTPEPSARLIALHPGSGSPRKNWPIERWIELAGWLRSERKAELLIVTGGAEPEGLLAEHGQSVRNLPLPELSEKLRHCRLFIGHDSGVSHLAAALGVPSVLLFGPTDSAIWAPPGAHVTVVHHGADRTAISVDEVKEALRRLRI
jgi:heptosyltransferase-3